MKQFLLSAALLAGTAFMSLAVSPQEVALPASVDVRVNNVNNRLSPKTQVKQLAPGVTLSTRHGIKRVHSLDENLNISPRLTKHKSVAKTVAPEGYALYESFEDWDGSDINWVPDGWTVEMKGNVDRDESWIPSAAGTWEPGVPDGNYYCKIFYGSDTQDEWLISPYVEVEEYMDLSYRLYLEPAFLYIIDSEHLDWSDGSFIGEPEVAATLQIWAQAEGEDWVMLRDYADEYKGYSYIELAMMSPSALEKNQVSLNDFYGKKTRVAFRLVGYDGNIMYLDAVGIGYPTIDDLSYIDPYDTQFWGLTDSPNLQALDAAIAVFPVEQPITWINGNESPNVSYTWTYSDPETHESVVSDDPEELTVVYSPVYKDGALDNLYPSPVLRAEAVNCAPSEFQAPYRYFQAGGKPGVPLNDGSDYSLTMLPFSVQQLGLSMLTVDDYTIGALSIPVFGHNANTDQYWLNYSLNGNEEIPGDYSHLLGIANLIWPVNDAPLVVKGVNVYGYGQIAADAELKVTIYGINSDLSILYTDLAVIATTTINGSDIIRQDPESKCYMCLPFHFDEPAVVQATDEYPAYFVMFEGFNSDKVEYFAPMQSDLPDPNYFIKGYILNEINMGNHIDRDPYYSIKTMRYVEDGEYLDCYGAFAIGLDAEYPWLAGDNSEVVLSADNKTAEVQLDSYYDASELTVEAPQGISATVSGRYNKCVLTVGLDGNAESVEGNIVVKGTGVEFNVPVSATFSGVKDIVAGNVAVKAVYDIAGRRIDAAEITPGVYIVKYADGSTRKLVIK